MTSWVMLRLILLGALILCSGFFAGSETALFSLGKVQILRLREQRHPSAELLDRLLGDPRRLIATIFIGNELVNVGASTLAASVTEHYLRALGPVMVVLVSTGVSVPVILLLGEITPKNLALELGERWATLAAGPLSLLARAFTPLRVVVEGVADATVRILGRRAGEHGAASGMGEDDFRTAVEVARQEGEIDPGERQLIHRLLDFGDRTVTDVMTPAERIFALSYNLPLARVIEEVRKSHYSRIPVYEQNRDRVIGILLAKDLVRVAHGLGAERRGLREMLRPPLFVPRSTKCAALLREFQRRKTHLALVVDEYGRTVGLVTLEDLLEEVFGEITDEKERRRRVVTAEVEVPQ
jgi:magnesium and cobalt exporter, CNNM family